MSSTTWPQVDEEERQRVERALHIRRFSDTEMARRFRRAREAIAASRLDALLLTDEVNVTYFTGMATPSFATRARPLIVIVPGDGEPVLICSRSQSANARAASAIQDIRPFERFEPDAIDVVTDTLRDLGLATGTIGCETGAEQRLGLTYAGFHDLMERMAAARFVDGSSAVWTTRLVKGEEELARMRAAGALNSGAMTAALQRATPGATEADVRRHWAVALAEGDGDRPGYFAIHSGPGSYRRVSGSATNRRFEVGDLVWMDGGPVYDGYWSDITRMAAVGHARPEDASRYAFAWDAVQELIAGIRPGITAGDVARRGARHFAEHGLPMGGASRIGHGIGVELTEPPSIVDGDETELVPGMTLSVETGIAAWDGYFLMEDNVVVTDTGYELLSAPAPPELPVIS